jgi:phospholipase/carboxylesterase
LLILMHGVGSNEADLFGLANSVPANWHVLSLRGPLTLGPRAFAWFEVQFGPSGPTINEAQERESRALLTQQIALAAQQLGVPASRRPSS